MIRLFLTFGVLFPFVDFFHLFSGAAKAKEILISKGYIGKIVNAGAYSDFEELF